MQLSITLPEVADPAIGLEKARRSMLRVLGHEGADTLHRDALAEALKHQNQLVGFGREVEDIAASIILHKPSEASWIEALLEDSTPDEAASVLTFVFDRLIEPHELGFVLQEVS